MNISEPDVALADIIATDMELDPSRVVVYDQNFKAPKDSNLYIIIAKGQSRVVSVSNRLDPDTDEDVKSVVLNETFNVEITSKSRDALDRHPEILMALKSTYSEQKQEEDNFRVFRTRDVMDLSFIEGPSALHRYRIPVIIHRVTMKRTSVTPIAAFQTPEVLDEPS